MGIMIHDEYMICNLEKHECMNCDKGFIVGTEMLDNKNPRCPYCGSICTEKMSWTTNDDLEALDLGCLALGMEVKGETE